jgi:2-oxo-4-hydroxy-4-carboxy-5-ureidoimidazoline decarboxylase
MERAITDETPELERLDALDALDEEACLAALAPLFEGAPRFLRRLCAARPFGGAEGLWERALAIALEMPEAEQVELVDAHPRLGAPPGSVSALSFREQGYEQGSSGDLAAELERLNEAYERRFGFRYCTFVAGRSRAELLPEFEARLGGQRDEELETALRAVVAIARDRATRLRPVAEQQP